MFPRTGLLVFIVLSVTVSKVISHYYKDEPCGNWYMRGVCRSIHYCPEVARGLGFGQTALTCGYTFQGAPIVCCPIHWTGENEWRTQLFMNTRAEQRRPQLDMDVNRPNGQNTQIDMDLDQREKNTQMETNRANVRGNSSSESVSATKCKEYNTMIRGTEEECSTFRIFVVGGEKAETKELPFMALIGYGRKDAISWECGGSLISPKFVLTAAHCVETTSGVATVVRLGELDTSRKDEGAQPVDFDVQTRIRHPRWKPSEVYNDIALIRLRQVVQFNQFIKPICLPQPLDFTFFDVIGAGWGRTDFVGRTSPVLLKVNLDALKIEDCAGTAENNEQVSRGLDNRTMLCAGKLDGGKDTCSGDSGGPLFLPAPILQSPDCNLRVQVGITSFGKQCGLPGFPGVYTRVDAYVKWIESIVWPSRNFDERFVWSK